MNNESHFESKIREKLDQHAVDYKDAYWKQYESTYPLPWYRKIQWNWKSHAIFAYTLLAFTLGYLWSSFQKLQSQATTQIIQTNKDTVYIVNSTNQRDTIYVGIPLTNGHVQNRLLDPTTIEKNQRSQVQTSTQEKIASSSFNKAEPAASSTHTPESTNTNNIKDNSKNRFNTVEPVNSRVTSIKQENTNTLALLDSSQNAHSLVQTNRNETEHDSATQEVMPTITHIQKEVLDFEDTIQTEDPEIAKINQRKAAMDWGISADVLASLPAEQTGLNYNGGAFGGLGVHVNKENWNLQTHVLYGVTGFEIDDIIEVESSTLKSFLGYNMLNTPPEDIHVYTQSMISNVEFNYKVWNTQRFSVGLGLGNSWIIPVTRLYIYDHSWQSQVRTRESLLSTNNIKAVPNLNLELRYQFNYRWNLYLKSKFFPTLIDYNLHKVTAISPVALQLGLVRYW